MAVNNVRYWNNYLHTGANEGQWPDGSNMRMPYNLTLATNCMNKTVRVRTFYCVYHCIISELR